MLFRSHDYAYNSMFQFGHVDIKLIEQPRAVCITHSSDKLIMSTSSFQQISTLLHTPKLRGRKVRVLGIRMPTILLYVSDLVIFLKFSPAGPVSLSY
jgi:hypothetical protein